MLGEYSPNKYFIQRPNQWYLDEDIGIQFWYNKDTCKKPDDVTVEAIIGGKFVKALHETYDSQTYAGPCN